LSEEHKGFMEGAVVVIAASAGEGGRASMAFALGCLVASDRRTVRVYIDEARSAELLEDVAARRPMAVVFCEPSTNRTIQLKGKVRQRRSLRPADRRRIVTYHEVLVSELCKVGEDEAVARALTACDPEAIVALEFQPTSAFSQTPGPRAGNPLQA
jgi:hypothetical protein